MSAVDTDDPRYAPPLEGGAAAPPAPGTVQPAAAVLGAPPHATLRLSPAPEPLGVLWAASAPTPGPVPWTQTAVYAEDQ